MDGGDGEESGKKEPRSVTGGDQDVLKTDDRRTTGRVARLIRGAGVALRKSRPRFKESVASTGAWAQLRRVAQVDLFEETRI
ncbi:hypothetical protein NDU88_004273 [Pleurodeles waltl]|uniref:Uncharacterized protein n=1 Tax=Pleurodeles waltl TaxID=8319 RepID=A0AAV7RHN4_PLEWA|nr:hypothetical protein NDU88_004273 [Pleurodeles waltl]